MTHVDIANAVLANALPHTERQAIPVVKDTAGDQIAAILRVLDATLAAKKQLDALVAALPSVEVLGSVRMYPGSADVAASFMARNVPQAEYALRLWASANGFEMREEASTYLDNDHRIRSLNVYYGRDRIAWVQWPAEPVKEPTP